MDRKEAIEIIKKNWPKDIMIFDALQTLIPELKESEDERIIGRIKKAVESYWSDEPLDDILAWLEKQGGQKPHNICDTCENRYGCISPCPVKLVGQNPAWSEEDRDYFDAIIAKLEVTQDDASLTDNQMEFLKSLKGRIQSQCRPSEGRQTIATNKDTEGVFGLKKNGDLIHYSKVDAKDKDEYESIVIVKGHTCIKMALHNPEGEFTFDKAQKAAASLGEGWRCPTRHEWIDIYDSRFNGLDELIDKLGGDKISGWYWTCEDDADPQYSSTFSWYAYSSGRVRYSYRRGSLRVCAVSAFQN